MAPQKKGQIKALALCLLTVVIVSMVNPSRVCRAQDAVTADRIPPQIPDNIQEQDFRALVRNLSDRRNFLAVKYVFFLGPDKPYLSKGKALEILESESKREDSSNRLQIENILAFGFLRASRNSEEPLKRGIECYRSLFRDNSEVNSRTRRLLVLDSVRDFVYSCIGKGDLLVQADSESTQNAFSEAVKCYQHLMSIPNTPPIDPGLIPFHWVPLNVPRLKVDDDILREISVSSLGNKKLDYNLIALQLLAAENGNQTTKILLDEAISALSRSKASDVALRREQKWLKGIADEEQKEK